MKHKKLIIVASALVLSAVGFFAKANKHNVQVSAAYFEVGTNWITLFTGASLGVLETSTGTIQASFYTGTTAHRLYATKGTSKPIFYE